MSAPSARAKMPESMEMNRIEGKTGLESVANQSVLSSGILLTLDSRCGAGYADFLRKQKPRTFQFSCKGIQMTQLKQYVKVFQWLLKGKPVPPPHLIKQRMVLESARRYKTQIMVETGTLLGDMVEAMKNHFNKIYSIEISPELAKNARLRFANNPHIQIIENDSAVALKTLVPEINEAAIFWLDGHYSGGETGKGVKETPIMEELASIFASDIPHIVLIDDARSFGISNDYPSLNQLESYVRSMRPNSKMTVKFDCIHIVPKHHN